MLFYLCAPAAILDYFLTLDGDSKEVAQIPLPAKVSGLAGGLAGDLYRETAAAGNFNVVTMDLYVRVVCACRRSLLEETSPPVVVASARCMNRFVAWPLSHTAPRAGAAEHRRDRARCHHAVLPPCELL
jgi:hypothetical protein